jgi:CheY-like chemotaxis protein
MIWGGAMARIMREACAMAGGRILIVEDDVLVAEDLVLSVEDLGFEVIEKVTTGEEALRAAEESCPDLILMDVKLKGKIDGIEAVNRIRSRCDIPVVYLTAYTKEDLFERAKTTEPYGFVAKPFNPRELRNMIETALCEGGRRASRDAERGRGDKVPCQAPSR